MEGRVLVRPAHAEEEPHRVANVGVQRTLAGHRADAAVVDDVFGIFLEELIERECAQALLTAVALQVEVALHDVVLAIDLGQTIGWLDHDHAVHAVRHVLADHGRHAVVDVDARVQRLEADGAGVPWHDLGVNRPATGTVDRVEVDAVRQLRAGRIL